ncbi:hypothetical protein [uncultured Shewanella sp.]|uniref:hypothetical protein n=1 Tax=uncultured Shewanella sp. TaxID=173975 RepID=UPI00260EB7DD|nr:hypothetical protein [uncultured Shewanella sp.]
MCTDPILIQVDCLKSLRTLPEDLIKDIPSLLVNREGHTNKAYMRTENFIGYAAPNEKYTLGLNGFTPVKNKDIPPLVSPVCPPRLTLEGEWINHIDLTIDDANILGGNGRYLLPKGMNSLNIPIADTTFAHLSYYGCHLVPLGETLSFDTEENIPLTITAIGEDYAKEFLFDPIIGGGAYLEVHDRPHFHMPLDPTASGYLIIGKKNDKGESEISAFNIPFGYGINMAPWTIHADSFLTGRYMVIYSVTKAFSTVIIRQNNGELAKVNFIK